MKHKIFEKMLLFIVFHFTRIVYKKKKIIVLNYKFLVTTHSLDIFALDVVMINNYTLFLFVNTVYYM